MVTTYMLTIPRTVPKKAIRIMLEVNDCKKWIVAKETGRGGFEHWQIRLETSNKEFFFLNERTVAGTDGKLHKEKFKDGWISKHIPQAHVEEAQDLSLIHI